MLFVQEIGAVVLELRARRLGGARIPELLDYLRTVVPGDRMGAIRYMHVAFSPRVPLTNLFVALDEQNDPEMLAHMENWIDERREVWKHQRFPILRNTRDYFSFLQVAVDERLLIFVSGMNPNETAYHLHGVYGETGAPVWSASRGERLRAVMNRRLGGELVLSGPRDDWEFRNIEDVAGPLFGPRLPVIEFSYERTIRSYLTIDGLAKHFIYRRHWERLYPHHSVKR
jgi:hypothetical protein